MPYRVKRFSKSKKKKAETRDRDELVAIGSGLGSAAILGNTKPGRLTGKVVRYHNTEKKNVENILKEGLKSRYAEDPENLTNTVLPDIDMNEKRGKVYTSKSRLGAFETGLAREYEKRTKDQFLFKDPVGFEDIINTKHNDKTLKLEFDYDELKGKKRIANPELRGAKTKEEFYEKLSKARPGVTKQEAYDLFKQLGEGTHVFEGDIDPKHIVGGEGYKRRTFKQIGKYIKNNPKRFGKEAAKVTAGVSLGALSIKKINDLRKDNNEGKKV